MYLSWTTLISSTLIGAVLLLIQNLVLRLIYRDVFVHSKLLILFNFLFILRMVIPFEFGYTFTIKSRYFLPIVRSFVTKPVFSLFNYEIIILYFLIGIWIVGSCCKMYQALRNYYALKKLTNLAKTKGNLKNLTGNRTYTFKVITGIESPAVVGIRNPVILLPDYQFTDRELEFVFKHVLIHISNFDLFVKYFYEFVLVLYWWNPMMYFFREQMSQVIELQTDEKVVECLSKDEKIAYIKTLTKIRANQIEKMAQYNCAVSFCYASNRELLQRSKNILNKESQQIGLLKLLSTAVLSLYLITSITFEPYFINQAHRNDVFEISVSNSYLIQVDQAWFDLYVDGKKQIRVHRSQLDTIPNLNELKIFDKTKGKDTNEKD